MGRFQHDFVEANPDDVELRDAATIMIVRDDPAFEVLMVQRSSSAAFGAKAWVFPGGRVDAGDGDKASDEPWRRAAVRETFEEAGLLLCAPAGLLAALAAPEEVLALRSAVKEERVDLFAKIASIGATLLLGEMHEVGRFITPVGPPRRFDTYFYLAAAPHDQTPSPDGSEVVDARWVSPRRAVEEWRAGTFPLMSVTLRMLASLARYESVKEVVSMAASSPDARRVRVNDPRGSYDVLLPEDDGYEDAELEIEHGWVRL